MSQLTKNTKFSKQNKLSLIVSTIKYTCLIGYSHRPPTGCYGNISELMVNNLNLKLWLDQLNWGALLSMFRNNKWRHMKTAYRLFSPPTGCHGNISELMVNNLNLMLWLDQFNWGGLLSMFRNNTWRNMKTAYNQKTAIRLNLLMNSTNTFELITTIWVAVDRLMKVTYHKYLIYTKVLRSINSKNHTDLF